MSQPTHTTGLTTDERIMAIKFVQTSGYREDELDLILTYEDGSPMIHRCWRCQTEIAPERRWGLFWPVPRESCGGRLFTVAFCPECQAVTETSLKALGFSKVRWGMWLLWRYLKRFDLVAASRWYAARRGETPYDLARPLHTRLWRQMVLNLDMRLFAFFIVLFALSLMPSDPVAWSWPTLQSAIMGALGPAELAFAVFEGLVHWTSSIRP